MSLAYELKFFRGKVRLHYASDPGWKNAYGYKDFFFIISPSNTVIFKIAKEMRLLPETVFQALSDGFDAALRDRTLVVENGRLSFDSAIASVTLTPDDSEKFSWKLNYQVKEEMVNQNFPPHPEEAFTLPDDLYCENVMFPSKEFRDLFKSETGIRTFSVGCLDAFNYDYHSAQRDKTLVKNGNSVRFGTRFRALDGMYIHVTLEANYYFPIPNTWNFTQIHVADHK